MLHIRLLCVNKNFLLTYLLTTYLSSILALKLKTNAVHPTY